MVELKPKYLDNEVEGIAAIKALPLAIVIEQGDVISVYSIPKTKERAFYGGFDNSMVPSIKSIEESCKEHGEKMTVETFNNASVFIGQQSGRGPDTATRYRIRL